MKKVAVATLFIVAGIGFLFSSVLKAEPEMAPDVAVQNSAADMEAASPAAASAEDENYSYGIIQGIDQKSDGMAVVTIAEYDYEGDQNVNTNYTVNADTQFENVKSAAELAKDDSVEIYFKTSGDDKVATRLIKEIIESDETAAEEEMPEPSQAAVPGPSPAK